ncbi:MAG: class I SAM-dependent methyltransferase [Nitrospirota bacterium]
MSMVHEAICRLIGGNKKGHLLDAAAGEGALSIPLSEMGFKVISCDLYKWDRLHVPFVNADLNQHLPFKDMIFDYIVCAESLQYLENQHIAFREFERILKKGGHLIISVPNILNIRSRLYFLRRGYFQNFKPFRNMQSHRKWDSFIYNIISFVDIYFLLKQNGFNLNRITAPCLRYRGLLSAIALRVLYYTGMIFDKNPEKRDLLRILASNELLFGDHIIIDAIKI